MITARVTAIEQHRRYRSDDDYPVEVLLRQLRGQELPSIKMRAGTAWHAFLETASVSAVDRVESQGFAFDLSRLDDELRLAPCREIAGERKFVVLGEELRVTGHVDGIHGLAVDDHKLTGQFDAQAYADSYQWRLYLALFSANRFVYNVFVAHVPDEQEPEGPTPVSIREFHRLTLYRYPEMDDDIMCELEQYVQFAREHLAVTHG